MTSKQPEKETKEAAKILLIIAGFKPICTTYEELTDAIDESSDKPLMARTAVELSSRWNEEVAAALKEEYAELLAIE